MRREIERDLDLKNLVNERYIVRPHSVAIEHLRIVLNRYVELVAKGRQVKRFEEMHVNDLLGASVYDGEDVAYRGV